MQKVSRLATMWKVSRLVQEDKHLTTLLALGNQEWATKSTQEIRHILWDSHQGMIQKVGGSPKWNKCSHEEQQVHILTALPAVLMSAGESLYAELPKSEKRELDLFIFVGCGMHKALNGFHGGVVAMAKVWDRLGVSGPVLLLNKDNATILQDITNSTEVSTSAEEHALEVSTGGGVKAVQLAGTIFNHKDDTKGQHDTFVYYFEKETGR
jgi:hypothetical protein